jgi:hypothetical protein
VVVRAVVRQRRVEERLGDVELERVDLVVARRIAHEDGPDDRPGEEDRREDERVDAVDPAQRGGGLGEGGAHGGGV